MTSEEIEAKLKELGVGIAPDDVSMNSRISMKGFVWEEPVHC